jgi:glutaredoxin 3
MSKIVIYSRDFCPYCVRAKSLLKGKNIAFEEIKIVTEELMKEVLEKSGGRTSVPQIFIDEFHVGGFDELNALNLSGKLDELLK